MEVARPGPDSPARTAHAQRGALQQAGVPRAAWTPPAELAGAAARKAAWGAEVREGGRAAEVRESPLECRGT